MYLVLKKRVYKTINTGDIKFIIADLIIVLEHGEKGLLSTREKAKLYDLLTNSVRTWLNKE